jgi:hypothetical protein
MSERVRYLIAGIFIGGIVANVVFLIRVGVLS